MVALMNNDSSGVNCPFPLPNTHTVEQLVKALRYKLEGRGFVSRCCHWNFSLT